jgi:hypothetical protein
MRPRVLILAIAVLLAAPAAAEAGCWATVKLSSVPTDTRAGTPWKVDITVKQHGVRLLKNAKPTVTIADADGSETVFRARKTGRLGVYRASVVFPAPGRWSYTIFDGFVPSCGQNHTFPLVTVR